MGEGDSNFGGSSGEIDSGTGDVDGREHTGDLDYTGGSSGSSPEEAGDSNASSTKTEGTNAVADPEPTDDSPPAEVTYDFEGTTYTQADLLDAVKVRQSLVPSLDKMVTMQKQQEGLHSTLSANPALFHAEALQQFPGYLEATQKWLEEAGKEKAPEVLQAEAERDEAVQQLNEDRMREFQRVKLDEIQTFVEEARIPLSTAMMDDILRRAARYSADGHDIPVGVIGSHVLAEREEQLRTLVDKMPHERLMSFFGAESFNKILKNHLEYMRKQRQKNGGSNSSSGVARKAKTKAEDDGFGGGSGPGSMF